MDCIECGSRIEPGRQGYTLYQEDVNGVVVSHWCIWCEETWVRAEIAEALRPDWVVWSTVA